jgi:hypothetical protein
MEIKGKTLFFSPKQIKLFDHFEQKQFILFSQYIELTFCEVFPNDMGIIRNTKTSLYLLNSAII